MDSSQSLGHNGVDAAAREKRGLFFFKKERERKRKWVGRKRKTHSVPKSGFRNLNELSNIKKKVLQKLGNGLNSEINSCFNKKEKTNSTSKSKVLYFVNYYKNCNKLQVLKILILNAFKDTYLKKSIQKYIQSDWLISKEAKEWSSKWYI